MISGLDYIMRLFLYLYPLRDKLDPVYIVSKLDQSGSSMLNISQPKTDEMTLIFMQYGI